MDGLVYLATPYSAGGADADLRRDRFVVACRTAAHLMSDGYCVFSPIAHSHPVELYGLPATEGHDFWLRQDFAILKHATMMIVVTMDGWKESTGIAAEMAFAREHKIPIAYMAPY